MWCACIERNHNCTALGVINFAPKCILYEVRQTTKRLSSPNKSKNTAWKNNIFPHLLCACVCVWWIMTIFISYIGLSGRLTTAWLCIYASSSAATPVVVDDIKQPNETPHKLQPILFHRVVCVCVRHSAGYSVSLSAFNFIYLFIHLYWKFFPVNFPCVGHYPGLPPLILLLPPTHLFVAAPLCHFVSFFYSISWAYTLVRWRVGRFFIPRVRLRLASGQRGFLSVPVIIDANFFSTVVCIRFGNGMDILHMMESARFSEKRSNNIKNQKQCPEKQQHCLCLNDSSKVVDDWCVCAGVHVCARALYKSVERNNI